MFHHQLLCLPKYENLVFCVASGCKMRSQFLPRNSVCVRVQDMNRLAQFEYSFTYLVQHQSFYASIIVQPFRQYKVIKSAHPALPVSTSSNRRCDFKLFNLGVSMIVIDLVFKPREREREREGRGERGGGRERSRNEEREEKESIFIKC